MMMWKGRIREPYPDYHDTTRHYVGNLHDHRILRMDNGEIMAKMSLAYTCDKCGKPLKDPVYQLTTIYRCDVCRGQRAQNEERLTSTDQLAWLEKRVMQLDQEISEIRKGNNSMGYALWCQPGSHSFDENEEGAKRVTTDMEDSKGVTREVTVHVCTRHAADLFKPQKRTLEQIRAEIEEATEIG